MMDFSPEVDFRGVLKRFILIWQRFTNSGRLNTIPKIVVSGSPLRVFDLPSEVIGRPETLKLGTIGQRCKNLSDYHIPTCAKSYFLSHGLQKQTLIIQDLTPNTTTCSNNKNKRIELTNETTPYYCDRLLASL